MMELVSQVIGVSLITIMFSIGLSITGADIARVKRMPVTWFGGLSAQMVLLPLIAFLMVKLFGLSGGLALGMMAIAVSPGGIASNAFTLWGKGNVALSVVLTISSSLLCLLTIPLVMGLVQNAVDITLDPLKTFRELLVMTVIPVGSGLLLRAIRPALADKLGNLLGLLSGVLLGVCVSIIWYMQREEIANAALLTGMPVLLMIVLASLSGWGLARLLRLRKPEQTTLLLEIGIQNSVLAYYLAMKILGNLEAVIPVTVYSVLMVMVGVIIALFSRKDNPQEQT